MKNALIALSVATAAVLCAAIPAQAQKMDTEVMMLWSNAKVVGYQIVGVYEGRVNVVGGSTWSGTWPGRSWSERQPSGTPSPP